jgi:citrate synthase
MRKEGHTLGHHQNGEKDAILEQAQRWWRTSVIDMRPGSIRLRGYPVQQLIGKLSFPAVIWLMLRGEPPTEAQATLLEAALVAGVDHGPQAPSIAVARMAMTCGLGINNAMASAINTLGDVHGGAGEQAVALYMDIARRVDEGCLLPEAAAEGLDAFFAAAGPYVPGFGHRFHPVDPRAPRLFELIDAAVLDGTVSGRHARIAREIERQLCARKGRLIPMNIDGATATIYAELGFAPLLARGLFVLSRSVGILAHASEQAEPGCRNKGPTPPNFLYCYEGPEPRDIAGAGDA